MYKDVLRIVKTTNLSFQSLSLYFRNVRKNVNRRRKYHRRGNGAVRRLAVSMTRRHLSSHVLLRENLRGITLLYAQKHINFHNRFIMNEFSVLELLALKGAAPNRVQWGDLVRCA